ncbi:MAG: 50S ribosomal protein L30 [Candidatus Zophobacter franzmannii]|jgi:large subunit ribosomal protein L30|nr:50S ribosomal protein L30 [Candidatus Zophobacter franzmannii]
MKIKVTQIKSANGRKETHRRVLASLGLGRIGKNRVHNDTPNILGMINKVSYLLKVEPVAE